MCCFVSLSSILLCYVVYCILCLIVDVDQQALDNPIFIFVILIRESSCIYLFSYLVLSPWQMGKFLDVVPLNISRSYWRLNDLHQNYVIFFIKCFRALLLWERNKLSYFNLMKNLVKLFPYLIPLSRLLQHSCFNKWVVWLSRGKIIDHDHNSSHGCFDFEIVWVIIICLTYAIIIWK